MTHLRPIAALFTALLLIACGAQKPLTDQPDEKPAASNITAIDEMDPQFLYLAAQNALKEGNTALATNMLTVLVNKDPDAVEPHIQLTMLLLQSGNHDAAEKHLATLLARENLTTEQQEQLQLTQIQMLLAKSRTEDALQAVNRFLETRPTHVMGRDLQARILSSEKRFDEALAELDKAIRIEELPEFRLLQAQLLIKTDNIAAARISLMRMQKLAPENDTPVLLLSALAIKENKKEEAEQLLRDFLTTHPNAFRVSHALGKLLIQEQRLVEAILVYRDAATRSGNNPAILQPLGMLYFQHKDYAEAEKTFRKLVEISPDDSSRFYLATSLEALERGEEARAIYESIDPASQLATDAQVRLAAIEIGNEELEKAAKRLQALLKQNPEHMDAHLMLSAIRLTQKRYQQLLDETEPLMQKSRLPAQLLFNRAVAFDYFKKYKQLQAMLNGILVNNPNHAEALNFLGYTYAIQGIHLDEAETLIKRALKLKPGDGYYLDSLAWVYYQRGDYARAVETQSRALTQITDDSVMHEHFGDMLWRSGEQEKARQSWQKAIELNSAHPEQLKQKIRSGLKEGE